MLKWLGEWLEQKVDHLEKGLVKKLEESQNFHRLSHWLFNETCRCPKK